MEEAYSGTQSQRLRRSRLEHLGRGSREWFLNTQGNGRAGLSKNRINQKDCSEQGGEGQMILGQRCRRGTRAQGVGVGEQGKGTQTHHHCYSM